MEADFSGYATKAGLKCSDGRVIMPNAFMHQDNTTVPLVWQHSHNDPKNVIGNAKLTNRPDGMYAQAFFNDSAEGKHARILVQHGDVVSLSIYASGLREENKRVMHGNIGEVSLVLSGANPGAVIDQVRIAHSDGDFVELEDEALIYTGLEIEHGNLGDSVEHAEGDAERTLAEVLATLNEEQTAAFNFVVSEALGEKSVSHSADASDDDEDDAESDDSDDSDESDDSDTPSKDAPSDDEQASDAASEEEDPEDAPSDGENNEGAIAHQEGNTHMTRNVFDQDGSSSNEGSNTLTHDQFATIFADAKKPGMTLNSAILAHAEDYGIRDIEMLFPEAKENGIPEINSRRMEWVSKVLGGTKHTPMAKVRSTVFDITADEARARGYVKGTKKVDEVITLLRRTTSATTIYKKQRLDRDDIIDITDMDVVAFLKGEMRLMIEEEVARAILVGDGRLPNAEGKVKDPAGSVDGIGIRSILLDDPFYSIKVELSANVSVKDTVKGIVRARSQFRGTGKPTFFVSDNYLTDIMLEEDKMGRALYETEAALRDKLRVADIVTVDLFDEHESLFGILVNLADYSIGTNKGGELTSFEDFDIDWNQHKYLQETRLSGALTKPFSAVVIRRPLGTTVTPGAPSFDGATNTITVPSVTGVVYQVDGVAVTGAVVITKDTELYAVPDEGYYFPNNVTRDWNYTYTP